MKKFLLGTVAVLALASQASAADLAARPYTKAPPMMAAVYDWTGFYIGANGGYGTSRNRWNYVAPLAAGPEGSHDADGAVAGGQIGYRWQAAQWVFGIEAQGNWADLVGSNASTRFVGITNRTRIGALGLFTGQIGYAWNNALLYAKGGAAVTDNRYDYRVTGAAAPLATASESRWGASVGAGLEFGFAPNWTAGVEYNHLFMGNRNITFTSGAVDNIRQDVDMVTARINYRWGGPVVARY